MSESLFLSTVEETLDEVQTAIEAADLPVECSQSGLVLTLELDDGGRIIINAQAPMRQLWLASRSGALHFAHDGRQWLDTRTGAEFFDRLSGTLAELLGEPVQLQAR